MEQSEGTFHEAILKICPHYFDFFDVMKDCSSSKPQINSEEFDEVIAEPLSCDDDDDSSIVNNNVIHLDRQNDDNTREQSSQQPVQQQYNS